MKIGGIVSVAIGTLLGLIALLMPITINSAGGVDVVNLSKMQAQLLLFISASALITEGTVLIIGATILERIGKPSGYAPVTASIATAASAAADAPRTRMTPEQLEAQARESDAFIVKFLAWAVAAIAVASGVIYLITH